MIFNYLKINPRLEITVHLQVKKIKQSSRPLKPRLNFQNHVPPVVT